MYRCVYGSLRVSAQKCVTERNSECVCMWRERDIYIERGRERERKKKRWIYTERRREKKNNNKMKRDAVKIFVAVEISRMTKIASATLLAHYLAVHYYQSFEKVRLNCN